MKPCDNKMFFQGLFVMNFALTLGFGIVESFFTVVLRSFGARGATLGIAIGCYAAAKILFGPMMGALTDRLGKKTTIQLSLILLSMASLLYLFTTDLRCIVILRIVQGIGFAMYRPAVVALIGDLGGTKQRGTVLGTFDVSFYAALGTAPLLGGIVTDLWGFGAIFPSLFSLCLLALTAFLFAVLSQPKDERGPSRRPSSKPVQTPRIRSGDYANHRIFSGLLIYIFGRACGIIIFVSFLPVLLISQLHLSGIESGIAMASTTIITALILRPMGKLADRCPRKVLIVAGGAAVSLLYLLIPSANSFAEVCLLGIGIGICSGVAQPASSAMLLEESLQLGTGFALGLFNTTLNLGFVCGSLAGALLQSFSGISAVFYVAGIQGIFAVALFSVLAKSEPAQRSMKFAEGGDKKSLFQATLR